MEAKEVESSGQLVGSVPIGGAKNSALLLLAASVVMKKPFTLFNVPDIVDVAKMCEILERLNITTHWDEGALRIDPTSVEYCPLDCALSQEVRTSVLFLGGLLGRFKEAVIATPGGCDLGPRPIDLHLMAMESFGASIQSQPQRVEAKLGKFESTSIRFKKATVTGTANAILCAVSLPIETVMTNCALEPEIDDLITFLNASGADIKREGSQLRIQGGRSMTGADHHVIPDRIEAGTFLIAAAAMGGDVIVGPVNPGHMTAVIEALMQTGADIEVTERAIRLKMDKRPQAVSIVAKTYPGFPTDLQPQWGFLASVSEGVSIIRDTVFAKRFDHMPQLAKLGVVYRSLEQGIEVQGVDKLIASEMTAGNLRSAAALVLGAMYAQGKSKILNIKELSRGYPGFFLKINNILND